MKRKVLRLISTFSLLIAIGAVLVACDEEPPFVLGEDGMAKLEYPDFFTNSIFPSWNYPTRYINIPFNC